MKARSINYSKARQYGDPSLPFVVKGITVHNTNSIYSAAMIYAEMQESKSTAGCHYLVDEDEVIQVLPLTQNAWHTGKGYDFGNLYTIAIEICRSQMHWDVYKKAQDRAVNLILDLMKEYNLTPDNIYFHSDFNPRTTCPHLIKEVYGTKKEWIRKEIEPRWH